jgi:predicted SAM-dependent methyltransferase
MTEKIQLGLKALRATTKNWLFLRFKKGIGLNIGAGGTVLAGHINVDSLLLRNTELISNIKYLHYFIKKGSVVNIYASHILEHFSEKEVRLVLKKLYGLLQDGGELRISVPDLDKIVKIYAKHLEYFQKRGTAPWIGPIYGGQTTKYDFHKTGFNLNWMKYLLEETGFKKVEEYDAEKFCREHGIADSSLYKKPFGEYVSLNVIAIK